MRRLLDWLDHVLPHPIRKRRTEAFWMGHECGQRAVRQAMSAEVLRLLREHGFHTDTQDKDRLHLV